MPSREASYGSTCLALAKSVITIKPVRIANDIHTVTYSLARESLSGKRSLTAYADHGRFAFSRRWWKAADSSSHESTKKTVPYWRGILLFVDCQLLLLDVLQGIQCTAADNDDTFKYEL
jgi:hypothetical protein